MKPSAFILACLVLAAAGCSAGTPVEGTQPAEISGTQLSECQRIDEPGEYSLTTDLTGASVEVSTQPELAPSYTGESNLERACIEITSPAVTLDCQGHTLTGSGQKPDATAGVYISGSPEAPLSGVVVENCAISAYQFGLYAGHMDGGTISGNEARRNNSIGFYLTNLSGVSVTSNIAEGNDPDGFLFIGNQEVMLSDNLAFYNRMRGITFEGCQGCVASRNESHSHGVLGYGIYGSMNMRFEENIAHDNRYHGFAILHEAGSATFVGNESYANEGVGFFLQSSKDNQYTDNLSHDNAKDGIAVFMDSHPNTFEGNTLRDNGGYGVFSDAPIDSAAFAGNTFSGNQLGETGSSDPEDIDWCGYTGFGPEGPCDPVFEGGPNLKDPQATGAAEPTPSGQVAEEMVIRGARIEGEPIYFPSMGDLWMPTWADDDRLFLTWGDGIGFGDGYPLGYPAYESPDPINVTFCTEDEYTPEQEGYFPCWLWCNVNNCDPSQSYPPAALTDVGVLAFSGPLPEFEDVSIVSIDVPTGEPFFLAGPGNTLDVSGSNDKPASLLFYNGRLYFAGHESPTGTVRGYLAYSEDYGQTWTEVPGSPWGETSNFRVLMFINMGQDYALNQDGYVYAFGVGTEASWTERTVYLARVPKDAITDYGEYEYFTGMDGDGARWSSNEAEATPVDGLHSTGQASAMYHEGTGRYLFMTTDANPPEGPMGSGALFEAPQPWGPWRKAAVLCFLPECDDGSLNPSWTDGKYIAGLIPKDAGPDYVYFTISGGDQHYQLQIGKLVFDIGP